MPRLRVFSGPNGSGKSTLFTEFSKHYKTGVYFNADEIEVRLVKDANIELSDFGIQASQSELDSFLLNDFSISLIKKCKAEGLTINLEIKNNNLYSKSATPNSYESSLISAFLRSIIVRDRLDYSFETVMSHHSKIEEIKMAKALGYKAYLYYICLDDPEVNISRVENRVDKGGHAVLREKILQRYYKSLDNLILAIDASDKTYLFDNSMDKQLLLLGKVEDGELEILVDPKMLPNWFYKYVLTYFEL